MAAQKNGVLWWRYATKKFDPSKKIPADELREILEALRLAPSSFGLQPWKFIVIADPDLRKGLRPYAWDQPQITEASHLVVLCAKKSMDEAAVKQYVELIDSTRHTDAQTLKSYEELMMGFVRRQSAEALSVWMKKQVYIALGFLLYECARRRIDACPMEGFDSQKFDEVLRLPEAGLESVVLCAMGYRSSEDRYAAQKKVRFAPDEVFIAKT